MASSSAHDIETEILAKIRDEALDDIQRDVDDIAEQAVDYAKSISPVYQGTDTKRPPGTFRDAWHTETIPDVDGMPAQRIANDDPAAVYIEYGTARTPQHAVMAKTAEHFKQVNDQTR